MPSKSLLMMSIGLRRACTQKDGMVAVPVRTSSEPVLKAQPDVSQGISRVIIMDHAATLSQSTSKSPLLSSPLLLMIQSPEAASHKAQVRS